MALQTKDFSVTGKSSSGGITYTYILRVTENSAKLVNGKPISNITVEAILKQSYSGLAFSSWTTTVTASINGSQIFSDTAQRKLSGTSEHVYYTWTGDIEHNADGEKKITVGGQLWQKSPESYSPPTLTITESSSNVMVLTPITVTTACTAPTAFTVSPSVAETEATLAWSGAVDGTNNAIVGYQVAYSLSSDGASWGSWTTWDTQPTCSPFVDTITGVPRGRYIRYRIRTIGSAGASYYSPWKESNAVRRNSPPGVPTNPAISASLIKSGDDVTVSWSASTDIDGNHNGYRLSRSTLPGEIADKGGYVTISGAGTTSRNVAVTGEPGNVISFYVRAEDKLGAVSNWLYIGAVTICGTVNINNGFSWGKYIAHISDGTTWHKYVPYIHDGTTWKPHT